MAWVGVLIGLAGLGPVDADVGQPVTLDAQNLVAAGYVAWQILVPEDSEFRTDMFAQSDEGSVAVAALWILDAHSLATKHAMWIAGWEAYSSIHSQAAPLPASIHYESGSEGPVDVQWRETYRPATSGALLVVVLVAADKPVFGEVDLIGDSRTIVLGKTTGLTGFARRSAGFEGAVNVQALNSFRWIEDARLDQATKGFFFGGFYGSSNSGDLEMSYQGPRIAEFGLTGYLLAGEPAGTHSFVIEHNLDAVEPCLDLPHLPVCPLRDVWGFGGDVELPSR